MDSILELLDKLNDSFPGGLKLSEDEQAVYVEKENLIKLLNTLKSDYGYRMLVDISAVECENRFEIVYHVMSLAGANVLRVKVCIPKEVPVIPSVTPVWEAADVQEREAFDLMGIVFEGHRNLRRILCSDDMVGHPLRKSFNLKIADRFKA